MKVFSGRPFVDLDLDGPMGAVTACTWVDTGGGNFFVSGELAKALGVSWELQPDHGEGAFGKTDVSLAIKNLPLEPQPGRILVMPGSLHQPGYPAKAFLPAHLMLGRDVLFDYPGGQFDVEVAGSMATSGQELPAPRHEQMGFPRVELEIDGERHGFLLDTGASYTMVSDALIANWQQHHPDWPVTFGASRDASMGYPADAGRLIRIPEVRWGDSVLHGVAMIARPEGTFERWMSSMMTAPIVGALAGNVLSRFRFQLGDDAVFLEQQRDIDTHDLDGVGLAVAADAAGEFTVLGICDAADESTKRLVRPGDVLLAIGGAQVTGELAHDVAILLGGPARETRSLTLRRETKELTVEVITAAILSD